MPPRQQFLLPRELADFDPPAALVYGKIRARLEHAGQPIGWMGTLIAAHAINLKTIPVTDNLREFYRVRGLSLEDWISS